MTKLFSGAKVHRHGRGWDEADGELLVVDGRLHQYGAPGKLSEAPPAGCEPIKLPGGRLIPAFFDAHLHLDQGGRFLGRLNLSRMGSIPQLLAAIDEEAGDSDELLIGIGLRENLYPPLQQLDAVSGGQPAIFYTRDYHSLILNSAALHRFGIDANTDFGEGGWQELDKEGKPTGVLRENSILWIEGQLPEETPAELRGHLERAFNHLISQGILGVSDAGLEASWRVLRHMHAEGSLPIRVEQWARCQQVGEGCFALEHFASDELRRTRIKLFADGALGSRTAWMHTSYADDDSTRGSLLLPREGFREYLERGTALGWSYTVHAIGDAALRYVVDHLRGLPASTLPHRIEHIQHADDESLRLLRESGIIASPQPVHRLEDQAMLLPRVGPERAEQAYPLRSLLSKAQPGSLALGTDWPVVDVDPRQTMRASLLPRQSGEGRIGDELTAEQALYGATAGAARAAGFAGVGETEAGSPADLVWLKQDPGSDPDAWAEVEVGAVWRSGELVHGGVD